MFDIECMRCGCSMQISHRKAFQLQAQLKITACVRHLRSPSPLAISARHFSLQPQLASPTRNLSWPSLVYRCACTDPSRSGARLLFTCRRLWRSLRVIAALSLNKGSNSSLKRSGAFREHAQWREAAVLFSVRTSRHRHRWRRAPRLGTERLVLLQVLPLRQHLDRVPAPSG